MSKDLNNIEFPAQFFEFLLKEISPEQFLKATTDYPELQSTIFKGFSLSKKKIRRIMSHPKVQSRVKNLAKHSNRFLAFLIELWGKENQVKVDFFRSLNPAYLRENFRNFKSVLGPSAFFCVLWNMNADIEEDAGEIWRFDEEFWKEEQNASPDFLLPFAVIGGLLEEDNSRECEEAGNFRETEPHDRSARKRLEKKLRKQREIIKSLEEKVDKLNRRHRKDADEIKRYRELLTQYKEDLEKVKSDVDDVIRRERRTIVKKMFAQYEQVTGMELIDSINSSLDSTFERVEKAFRLQQESDAEYGRISELRTKLIKINQYLDEIARIYSDSVFVHSEIKKVKKMLEKEKERILSLPRSEMIVAGMRDNSWVHDLVRNFSLLEPTSRSLQKLKSLKTSIDNLCDIGVDVDIDYVYAALKKKESTILSYLSEKFCSECDPEGKIEIVKDFDEFIKSRVSRNYDLYIDAYNILLSANENNPIPEAIFKEIREQFTRAVIVLGNHFNRVFLVYDGVSTDREMYDNVEVFFADKFRGESADEIIIRLLNRRKDCNAVLATADKEIISRTTQKVFATVEPHSFFSCLYEYGFTITLCGRPDNMI